MVAKRMLRTVQQGARLFFCDDGPRRPTPSPYERNALSESGDPGITALCDAALAAVSL